MEIESRLSHLIAKYQRQINKNPASRVFAPLAECYRKAGMVSDALVTLRDGLRHNPDSVLGHIGLAQCYFDQGEFEKVYETLLPFKKSNLDNIKLLRLFAESCLKIKKDEEALEAYKYILFLNPKNEEAIGAVSSLEDEVYTSSPEKAYYETSIGDKFPIEKLEESSDEGNFVDGWETINFFEESQHKLGVEDKQEDIDDGPAGGWSMESITEPPPSEEVRDEEIVGDDADRSFKVLTNDSFQRPRSVSEEEEKEKDDGDDRPLITHTLVDLYCAQGHYEQAHQLLKKILELNPEDDRTARKMKEVEGFLDFEESALEEAPSEIVEDEQKGSPSDPELDEEQAHEHLASLVESKVQVSKRHKVTEVEHKLWLFHEKLSERARS